MLCKLCESIGRENYGMKVLSLMGNGTIGKRIERAGVPVFTLGMTRSVPSLFDIRQLVKTVQLVKPDLIQGWMYHGNLAASYATKSCGYRIPLVWNIRQTLYELKKEKFLTRIVFRAGSLCSAYPSKIIYNSRLSCMQHQRLGYSKDNSVIIPNGFNVERFSPNEASRSRIRKELGVSPNILLVGLIARYHPMKDHKNFLHAAGIFSKQEQNVKFVMVGPGVDSSNRDLRELISSYGVSERVQLLGEREDVEDISAALDILTSSSAWGEGFSNVIAEAMACGVPCVVTDVGDSSHIVGEYGLVVPPSDSSALSNAWHKLAEGGRDSLRTLGQSARQRVIKEFSIDSVASTYVELYKRVIADSSQR
jgi:glycosyltransferase involved in cell wall biosynthesis